MRPDERRAGSTRDARLARLAGRIGGLTLHAHNDSNQIAARARRGFMARFERQVDPDNQLPPEERERRAARAMKAHMATLAMKSAAARRKHGGRA